MIFFVEAEGYISDISIQVRCDSMTYYFQRCLKLVYLGKGFLSLALVSLFRLFPSLSHLGKCSVCFFKLARMY